MSDINRRPSSASVRYGRGPVHRSSSAVSFTALQTNDPTAEPADFAQLPALARLHQPMSTYLRHPGSCIGFSLFSLVCACVFDGISSVGLTLSCTLSFKYT